MRVCCDTMKAELEKVCAAGHAPRECPDTLVAYVAKFDEYGLVVHDGGTSLVQILFCPWCGSRLPESKRDGWFAEMERRQIDPWQDEVPAEFQSDAWYRKPAGC